MSVVAPMVEVQQHTPLATLPVGTYYLERTSDGTPKWIVFRCAGKYTCRIPLLPTQGRSPWTLTLDKDGKVSVTPSINCKGCWHGHFTNGVMTAVEDSPNR